MRPSKNLAHGRYKQRWNESPAAHQDGLNHKPCLRSKTNTAKQRKESKQEAADKLVRALAELANGSGEPGASGEKARYHSDSLIARKEWSSATSLKAGCLKSCNTTRRGWFQQ